MRRLLLVERLANASSKDGRMAPSTSSKKDLDVVAPLITAEKAQASFFCREGSFFCACTAPFPVTGFWEFLHLLYLFLFDFVLFSFSFIFNNSHIGRQSLIFQKFVGSMYLSTPWQARDYSLQSASRNNLFYFGAYFCFLQVSCGSYFSRIFLSACSSPTGLKI